MNDEGKCSESSGAADRRLSEPTAAAGEGGQRRVVVKDGARKQQVSPETQEAGDSGQEDGGGSRTTQIAARPVPSGGFSTSSVSEEFVKSWKQIEKYLDQSAGGKMQEGDLRDNGEDKTAEAVPSGAGKSSKDEANRLLKFQISAPEPASSSSCCHGAAGHGRCSCRRKGRVDKHRHGAKTHDCGRSAARSHSSSCRRRRHRSVSSAVDKRERRRDQCPAQGREVAQPSSSHRRQRHHHYRHQRRVRDGEFGDSGTQPTQPPPACSRSLRRCCRSGAAGSDACCLKASRKHTSNRERHQCPEEECEARQVVQDEPSDRKTCGKNKTHPEDSGKREGKSGEVFSRYRSNYCSADGDRSSSSSSSEDDTGEEARRGRLDRNDGSRTLIFTQTRQSSSQVRGRREIPSGSHCVRQGSPKRCADGPVQSTVEKHVLELNFPPSPLMRSISNLLQMHCPCSVGNKEPVEDDEGEGDGQEKDDNDDDGDHFVHRMKPGQTCELQGEGQVVLVSLPEPHKLTVEHVIHKSTSLMDQERCNAGCRDKPKRDSVERDRKHRVQDRKEAIRCEEALDVPRFRRKHSYVRHTRRSKGADAAHCSPVIPKAVVHRNSSPESDSSEDDEPNELTYSKERGTDEVLVRPVVRSGRPGRGDRDGCVGETTRQRELRVSIPKINVTGAAAEVDRMRSSGRRMTKKRTSKASSAGSDEEGHRSGCVEAGSGGGGEDNTLRIVFTDSRLNTELRCILQDSSETSGADRHGRRYDSSRTALTRRDVRPRGGARRTSDDICDNNDADNRRGQQCGCDLATEQRQRARHGPEASDIVSSSYYSSTHESSVALNEVANAAAGGCTLCRTMHAMGGCAKERPCRQPWQRNKNARR